METTPRFISNQVFFDKSSVCKTFKTGLVLPLFKGKGAKQTIKITTVESLFFLRYAKFNYEMIIGPVSNTQRRFDEYVTDFGNNLINLVSFMVHSLSSGKVEMSIRYARCCSNYSGFLSRHRALVTRLLSQGYKVNRLSNTFKKFYGRH